MRNLRKPQLWLIAITQFFFMSGQASPKLQNEEEPLSAEQPEYGTVPMVPTTVGEGMSDTAFYVTLFCAVSNVFLGAMDSTMVATLLEVIASDLEAMENVSWVATSYLLSCAAFQPLFGKISDVFGRRIVVFYCVVFFGFGCLLSGVSSTLWWLVAGRFISGIGAGGMMAMATIVVSDVVPNRQRGLYQGYVNIFFNCGAASGGVIAGVIQRYFGWRNAFLLQVPVCIFNSYLTYNFLKLPAGSKGLGVQGESARKKIKTLDYGGSIMLVLALLALMFAAAIGGRQVAFSSKTFVGLIAGSLIGLVVFYLYEKHVAVQPVIPVYLLHNRTIFASSLDCWFSCMNMFVNLYYVPFYWASVKNLSPLQCGLRLIVGSVVASLSSIYAGWYIKKTSRYWNLLMGSGVFQFIGSLCIYCASRTDGVFKDNIINLPTRYGGSCNITVILVAMISAVSHSEQALVTSIQYGFRSTGSTLGVSIATAIMEYGLQYQVDQNFASLQHIPAKYADPSVLNEIKRQALKDPHYAFQGAPLFFKESIIDSYDSACHYVFLFLIATAIASWISVLCVEENDLNHDKK